MNYATTEPAPNVVPLFSPLPPQLENVVDIPGYSEVPVNIKKVLSMCNERTHPLLHPFQTNDNKKEKGST